MATAKSSLEQEVCRQDKEYVLHSWSTQGKLDTLAVAGAEGSYFWDYEGNRYLDFSSQLVNVNLGHQHPAIVEAIVEQARKLCTIKVSMANDKRSELAQLLAEVTPGNLKASYFVNGGAEANENAIKVARWYTGRSKIVARYRSYHGATAGALTLTGDPRRWSAEPGIPGVVHMLDPYTYRCPAGHPDPCPVCSGGPHLEELLQYEGPETVAAVILETVTGTNGVFVPPDGYLRSIRDVCDRHGILLILDEVLDGFGRTGRWFACEHWDVVPDIITLAKGINSGSVPLGAMVVSEPIAEWLQDEYLACGLTTSGHPLACAAGVASIRALRDEGVVENAAAMGDVVGEALSGFAKDHRAVGEVRGLGLLWAIELVKSRSTREPLVDKPVAPLNLGGESDGVMSRISKAAMKRGVSLIAHSNMVIIAPPLTITRAELNEGLTVVDEVLGLADDYALESERDAS